MSAPEGSERPYDVRFVTNLLIPMRDGACLAANLSRLAADGRFPVILEYLPYRTDDWTLRYHRYYAEQGYIMCHLDIRGMGASEGVNTDEYTLQEQQDGYDAVERLARQPWCDGQVAIYGSSYGGFVAYQIATYQPPISRPSSPSTPPTTATPTTRTTGGGLLRYYYDFAAYGASMIARNALPPHPDVAGADWARI